MSKVLVPCPCCGAMVEPKYNKDKKFVIQAHNPPPNNIKGVNHRVLCPGSYEFVQGYKPADGLIG